ncbi:MAG: zinc-ribbon domain-containing protein [Planctomycetaceae bacterium]|jgi:flagellar basal body-associated protein FliL|nr:zinc-ribbon domain-containing protein [Planctomycetaceae bacterium]
MITFNCSCGKKYQLPDRLAGREVRCNQCGNALIIPNPEQIEPTEQIELTEQTEPTTDVVTSATVSQYETEQWGTIPVPDGVKNEQSPIVSGWATGPYQKGSSCILTIVLVLLGACSSFFVGFLAGSVLFRSELSHRVNQSELYDETEEDEEAEKETTKYTAANWKIDENSLTLFTAQTANDGQIQISLDKNPPVVGEKTKKTLDDIADALGTDDKPKDLLKHNQTLRIHSESNAEFRLVWPSQGLADFDAGKLREIHFSLFVPDKVNAGFKPVKPEGVDKVLILSKFSLRLVTESGFIEFVPENTEKFVSILEHAKSDWVPIQIPLSGNEIWKRIDHGIFGSRTHVKNIELYSQPTGNGVTLWIDNLEIKE